jgi:haloacetate dehalogenase
MFEGFTDKRIDVGEVELRVRHAGQGVPILLIHGHPRTGATWHRVAPLLVDRGYRVGCPDMRGYGQSGKAPLKADPSQQAKRAVAADMLRLMNALGQPRFAVVGHDRGSYVALRLAMDHPQAVDRMVVIDGVPISEALARCDASFARSWYHWFFFAQPDKPERAINADPDAWYCDARPERMGAENYREFRQAIHDPDTIRAMLEDYRAGLGVDREQEEADRRVGRTVGCPMLLLWTTGGDMVDLYGDPLAVWRPWVEDLRGHPVESGHHFAEENPDVLTAALHRFLA